MRIISGSSLFFASLALSGFSYAAPAGSTLTDPASPAAAIPSIVGGQVRVVSDANKARFFVNLARSDGGLRPGTVPLVESILKPVEHVPCGLGVSTPHHVPPGLQVDCPELNNRIIEDNNNPKALEKQPTSKLIRSRQNPRALPTPTEMLYSTNIVDVDPSSYPPTEPSSFYEIDPTLSPAFTNPPEIPVVSAIQPTVPGGPTITAIVGHLSIVLDHPPPPSTSKSTSTTLGGVY